MDLQKIAGFKPNSSEPMAYFDIYKEQYKIALEFVNENFQLSLLERSLLNGGIKDKAVTRLFFNS